MEHLLDSMDNISNKDKILNVAIDLFAQKGYANVSMREIAGAVGIKAASIYNHFESKEAILEEIVAFFRQQLQKQVYPAFEIGASADVGEFLQNVTKANETFFSVPLYAKIGSIVLCEQFHNEKVRSLLLEELIVRPREAIAAYFDWLIHAGKMRPVDPVLAAKEYHAFYIYEFYENSLSQRPNSENERVQMEHDEHIRVFLQNFCL